MAKRTYEHRANAARRWVFRGAWTIAALVCVQSFFAAIRGNDLRAVVQGTGIVLGLYAALLLLPVTCVWLCRPRITVVDDEARVLQGEFGTVRTKFRWTDVVQWQAVISPNEEESGPPEYRSLVVTLTGRSAPLYIWDAGAEYLRAFEEHAGERIALGLDAAPASAES